MATLINKMVSWAAREAEELASKSGMSLEKAVEEVADKYGQKAFSATAKPAVEEFATSTPSMFLGDANAPRNKSLREMISPGVEESITAREASRYTEPSLLNRPVSGAGEKAMLGVQESTMAREASRYKEPTITKEQQLALPPGRKLPGKSDTSASEDFEASLGELDTGIYPQMNIPKAGKAAAGAGLVGAGMALTGDARQPSQPQYSDLPEGVDKQEFNASLQKALQEPEKKSTPELKKTISQSLKQADKSADNPPPTATPEQVDKFKEQRDRAYELYDQAKSRNEWLELAQILGRAGVQLVAAQGSQGKYGRDYSNIPMGPGVDYGARTAASQRMLESRLRDVERGELLRERAQDAAERKADRRERLGLERARLQMEAGRPEKKSPEEMLNLRESLLQKRQEEAESRKEQAAKEKAMESAIGAQQILASGDATNKQKDKARETLATSAAQAGIDLDKLEEQSMVPGKLWGQNLDEKKKLANLRAALDELRAGRSRQSAPQSGSMPQGGGMVTVTHKATGQSKQFPAGSPEAQRAQQDPEFEVK